MPHYKVEQIPEIPFNEVSADEIELVISALSDPIWEYRTISGIEKDTQVSASHIAAVLDKSGIARRTAFTVQPGNQAVYASADKPVTIRERIARIGWLLQQ
ncbi:MAG TPA: hypothetical protein VL989_00075 [Candidatus Sulfotelmatobacter sp.]|nr:hypothetical protein [Candidatus Sulfotelmatobacter sp.]